MNTVTINVTMSKNLMDLTKQWIAQGWYTSVSEVVRSGVRRLAADKEQLTINGFTREFEDEVLMAAAEPVDYSKAWESEEDIDRFFASVRKEVKKRKE